MRSTSYVELESSSVGNRGWEGEAPAEPQSSDGMSRPGTEGMQAHIAEISRRMQGQDSFAAVQYVQQQGAPEDVCALFHKAALARYNDHKDVAGMIALLRAGIQYGLAEAERCIDADREQSAELKGAAKAMAYDLGSNTWPGWQDDGVSLTASDRRIGSDAARLNLRLAIELQRDHLPLCNAHWLLGAHQLADDDAPAAAGSFATAAQHAVTAGRPEFESMCHGYSALARYPAGGPGHALEHFARSVSELRGMQADDATFFADQLESVRRFFSAAGSDNSSGT